MSKEIMLNRMYSGDYIKNESNIGHEIINLFRDDKGRNYIYAMPYGTVAKEHNGRIEYILLVRWVGKNQMEVLAKAFELKQILYKDSNSKENNRAYNTLQKNYINENDITFGGIRLDKLLESNIYKGKTDSEDTMFVTFQAGQVIKPKQAIYITDKPVFGKKAENIYYLKDINFSKQSPKMYYSETDVAAYNVLKDIINNEELWESTNTTQKVDLSVADTDEHYNYLKLIRKEYDEVIFSNLFKHYFTVNEKVFVSFCKEVLNGIELDDSYSIDRETEDNIDLLIQDDGNVIVIENKVKSGINGIKHDLYSDEIQSQLCKYYEYAQSIAADRKISCFIFAPDYKYFDLSGYKSGDYYKIVEYSKIYKFFNEHKEDFNSDKYFSDFLNALYKHSLKVDNELYDEMYRRFIQRINELSK